ITLMATRRLRRVSQPDQTSAKPPLPIISVARYAPIMLPGETISLSSTSPQPSFFVSGYTALLSSSTMCPRMCPKSEDCLAFTTHNKGRAGHRPRPYIEFHCRVRVCDPPDIDAELKLQARRL